MIWEKNLYTTDYEYGFQLFETTEGGYAVLAYERTGDSDYALLEFSENREIISENTYGGTFIEEPGNFLQAADGGYIICGDSNSADGDVSNPRGGYDVWIVKTNDSGEIEWEKNFGGTQDESGAKLYKADDGFLLITSSYSSDGDAHNNYGGADFWIVKLSENLEIEWENNFGGSGQDVPVSAFITSEQQFIIAGHSDSQDYDVQNPKGDLDYWVIKLDGNGDLIWEKTFGGTGEDETYGMIKNLETDNQYLIFGNSTSYNGDVSNANGSTDGWIVNIDTDGNVVWDKSFGDQYHNHITDFKYTQNTDGFIYSTIDFGPNNSTVQNSIATTDLNGTQTGELIFGFLPVSWMGPQYIIYEIKPASDGNYLVTGGVGDDTYHAVWFAKIGIENLSNSENKLAQDVKIYPNPAEDFMTINSTAPIQKIEIYNATGNLVFESGVDSNLNSRINIRNLPAGSYIISIQTPDGIQTKKFLKQNP